MQSLRDHLKKAIRQAGIILCVSLFLGIGVNSFSRNGINPFRYPMPAATIAAGIRKISLEEVQQVVGSGIPVIDARSQEDFNEGHIPGAIPLPYHDMGSYLDQAVSLFSTHQSILIYCSEAACMDAELLAYKIIQMGYAELLVFKGGFNAWAAAGLPIEGEAP